MSHCSKQRRGQMSTILMRDAQNRSSLHFLFLIQACVLPIATFGYLRGYAYVQLCNYNLQSTMDGFVNCRLSSTITTDNNYYQLLSYCMSSIDFFGTITISLCALCTRCTSPCTAHDCDNHDGRHADYMLRLGMKCSVSCSTFAHMSPASRVSWITY